MSELCMSCARLSDEAGRNGKMGFMLCDFCIARQDARLARYAVLTGDDVEPRGEDERTG